MLFSIGVQIVNTLLTIALIVRIFSLRLYGVYRAFSIFLLFEVFSSSVALSAVFIERISPGRLDYRIIWIPLRVVAWILSLWMVYALVKAILVTLPGILRFSKRVLNVVIPAAVLIALITARPEYAVAGVRGTADPLARAVLAVLLIERVISTIALLALVSILLFILWFPVQMPRNLAILSVGFVVYFASKSVLLLLRSFWSHEILRLASNGISIILIACFIYWLLLLNAEGETARVRIGHSWRAEEQGRLIGQLEAMNTALLRAARR